jgi:hypothetical protein
VENEEIQVKERHGCVTAWLIFMIVTNSVVLLLNLTWKSLLDPSITDKMARTLVVAAVLNLANIGFAIALLRWKLWGFFGMVVTSVLAFILNLKAGFSPFQALPGLFGIVVLFAFLQMRRNEISAWDLMEKRVRREEENTENNEE